MHSMQPLHSSDAMKANTRQHYVPRFYLKGWCDAKDYLWAFPVSGKPPFQTSVENVACEKGLYTHPVGDKEDQLETEKMMAKIESLYAPVWPDICDRALNTDTRMNIARFLALMALRHPGHEHQVRRMNEKILSVVEGMTDDEEIEFQIKERSGNFTVGEIRRFSSLEKDGIKSGFLNLIPALVPDIANTLASRNWGIVFADYAAFLTSDCPVLLHRGKATKENIGFRTPGTQILFPISPFRLLTICDDWPHSFAHYKLAKPDLFNGLITSGANRFVFNGTNDSAIVQKIRTWRDTSGPGSV